MRAYSNLGSYYIESDPDSSNFYVENALSIAVRLNLKFDEACILNLTGVILMQQEKFSKTLELYLKALNIAKDPAIEKTTWYLPIGQSPTSARMLLLSDCYDLIGLLNAYTGNWTVNTENQLKNYREAEKYAKAAGISRQIADINFHMGIAYMNERKLDSALMLIKNAISTFSDLKDHSGLGRAMKYLGDTYEKMGNFDLAANEILQALPFLKESNDDLHLGIAYISLSRISTDLKKNDSALYYAKESLNIFEKRKDRAWKRDAYNLLTSCFDQLGRTDSYGESWCTSDRAWCVAQDGAGVQVGHGGQTAGSIAVGEAGDGNEWVVWPVIVRVGRDDASARVGVALATTQMYSGGSGTASQLILYSVEGGAARTKRDRKPCGSGPPPSTG